MDFVVKTYGKSDAAIHLRVGFGVDEVVTQVPSETSIRQTCLAVAGNLKH